MVQQAHAGAPRLASEQQRLVQRYSGAVYAYLLGGVRDREAADELFQEFALRVIRGDFARAHPERGRFRDYLRRVLINLVNDHHRARKAWPQLLAGGHPEPAAPICDDDPSFLDSWRQELLERTWRSLETANATYHAVLRFRVENPDVQSPEAAAQLSAQLGKPLTPELVRKTLQRSQAKFAELLLEEVAAYLGDPSSEELTAELQAVDLLKYCRSALERWKDRPK
jgi:RNA polymerase sigma-70 factor (ECF subfamily)